MIKNEQTTVSSQIEKFCFYLTDLDKKATDLENQLKETNKKIEETKKELCDLLASEGIGSGSTVKLSNGRVLKVKDFFSASIPTQNQIDSQKDLQKQFEMQIKRQEGLKWLEENNLADIIKNEVIVAFDKGENEKAKQLLENLQKEGLYAINEINVNPMTLKAVLKKEFEKGLNIPEDVFSVYTGIAVDIK
jgi:hypothetical protein